MQIVLLIIEGLFKKFKYVIEKIKEKLVKKYPIIKNCITINKDLIIEYIFRKATKIFVNHIKNIKKLRTSTRL